MNIQEAKTELIRTVRAYTSRDALGNPDIPAVHQRPVLLIGPPGIGKTAIMEQAAAECGVALVSYTITHHTRQSAVGLPVIREKEYNGTLYSATEYTMSEIVASVYETMKRTGLTEGILFIDEINCVSETLAPTMLQLLQNKTFGSHRIPESWVIAAAGNPPEYNRSVREFDMVTLDRVKKIEVTADLAAWKAYAGSHGIHPAILAYLELHPEQFYRVKRENYTLQFITARGWEDLSRILLTYEKLGIPADEGLIIQYIQDEEAARDFALFLQLYDRYQRSWPVDEVLAGAWKAAAPEKSAPSSAGPDTGDGRGSAPHRSAPSSAGPGIGDGRGSAPQGMAVSARMAAAPFDERIAVIQLLTDKINRACEGYQAELRQYDRLSETLSVLLSPGSAAKTQLHTCSGQLEALLARRREILETKKSSGILTADDALDEPALLADIGKLLAAVKGEGMADGEARRCITDFLAKKEQPLRESAAQISRMLSNAFLFLNTALPDQTETSLLTAGLSACPAAMSFIRSHGCPEYDAASRRLLAGKERERLLAEIDRCVPSADA